MEKNSWNDRVRMEKQYTGSRTSGISYIPEEVTLTGLVRSSKTRDRREEKTSKKTYM